MKQVKTENQDLHILGYFQSTSIVLVTNVTSFVSTFGGNEAGALLINLGL